MKTAVELRAMANVVKKEETVDFWKEYEPKIASLMEGQAECGNRELIINQVHAEDYWLSKPHLYNYVIEELKKMGFTTVHEDNCRDGAYLIIRW